MIFKALFLVCLFFLIITGWSNPFAQKGDFPSESLFAEDAPQSKSFKAELEFLHRTQRVTPQEKQNLESELENAEKTLGVPKSLIWCILFQESRFNPYLNATNGVLAKGLGQFTPNALSEINLDTDLFDPRTSLALKEKLKPKTLPIDFKLKPHPKIRKPGTRLQTYPPQPVTSYYHYSTAVIASAAYLNNRYQQLKAALDHQGLSYDPKVLWLFAAAAYNKGARSVFALLTREFMLHGERSITKVLTHPKAAYLLLTQPKKLDPPFGQIWDKATRKRYIDELLINMEMISRCSISRPLL